MLKINELKVKRVKPNMQKIIDSTKNIIEQGIIQYFQDKTLFSISDDLALYEFDEFTIKTNTFEDFSAIFYLEINQPNNINKNHSFKDKIIPSLHLPLEKIKNGLFETFINFFNENSIIWLDKYSINISSNYTINEGETKNYFFKVIPCLTYKNEQDIFGVLYYTDNLQNYEIEYPELAKTNFLEKNKRTNGAFLDAVLIFKNIYSKQDKTMTLPFEIFETILYNVPDNFFKSNFTFSALQIINYLRNKNLKDYLTMDEQDFAFVSINRSMSYLYVKRAISLISNYIKSNI